MTVSLDKSIALKRLEKLFQFKNIQVRIVRM